MISVSPKQFGSSVQREVVKKLQSHDFSQVLAAQAVRRIDQGGDSQHKYPELWATTRSFVAPKSSAKGKNLGSDSKRLKNVVVTQHYRAGGQPLFDRGPLKASLRGRQKNIRNGVRLILEGSLIAAYHNEGFKTDGPNFIPLTLAGARLSHQHLYVMREISKIKKQQKKHRGTMKFIGALRAEKVKERKLEQIGLVEGIDYIMAWRGVNVPQRKIYNMPPENVEELEFEIARAMKG